MFTATLILIIILAVLLILIVLIQNSKGGLSPTMGSASSQLIGVKKTTDILEKFTWGLAISIMVLCLVTNFVLEKPSAGGSEEEVSTVNMERAQENPGSPQPAKQAPASSDSGKK
jgi:preprotein translocase subunit SecG